MNTGTPRNTPIRGEGAVRKPIRPIPCPGPPRGLNVLGRDEWAWLHGLLAEAIIRFGVDREWEHGVGELSIAQESCTIQHHLRSLVEPWLGRDPCSESMPCADIGRACRPAAGPQAGPVGQVRHGPNPNRTPPRGRWGADRGLRCRPKLFEQAGGKRCPTSDLMRRPSSTPSCSRAFGFCLRRGRRSNNLGLAQIGNKNWAEAIDALQGLIASTRPS